MRINELILYRKFAEGRDGLLQDMAGLVAQYEECAGSAECVLQLHS